MDYSKLTPEQRKKFIEGFNFHAKTHKFKARRGSMAWFGESVAQRHTLRSQLENSKLPELPIATLENFDEIVDMANSDDAWIENYNKT